MDRVDNLTKKGYPLKVLFDNKSGRIIGRLSENFYIGRQIQSRKDLLCLTNDNGSKEWLRKVSYWYQ